MTPEIKAKELVEKYMYEMMAIANVRERYPSAKQCALIAVDEILNEQQSWIRIINQKLNPDKPPNTKMFTYWEDVKKQINLL